MEVLQDLQISIIGISYTCMLFIPSFLQIGLFVCVMLTFAFKTLPFTNLNNCGTNLQIDYISTAKGKCKCNDQQASANAQVNS